MNTIYKFLGVLPDNRTVEEKENSLKHPEIFGTSAAASATYHQDVSAASGNVHKFPVDDQQGTSSCVAHGKALATAIFRLKMGITPVFVQLASMFIYRNRVNYPGEGMIPASADMQVENAGAPPYADMPTPATEAEANAMPTPDTAIAAAAKSVAGIHWVELVEPGNIDTIAFVANNQQLPVNILIYATIEEWSQPVVEILIPGLIQGSVEAAVSHCITVLPDSAYIGTNGKKYVIIQDSAAFGGIFFRSVSSDFLAARTYESAYPISLDSAAIAAPVRPVHTFNVDLTIGSQGADVLALQEILQYLGYMPNVMNAQPFAPTNYYGALTKSGVALLQDAYAAEILTPAGLTTATGYCGPGTRAWLNENFSK